MDLQPSSAFYRINALSQEQRESALDGARKRIAGAEPQTYVEPALDDYERTTAGRFPRSVVRIITGLSVLMLIAAFLPSAMRLHEIGRETFAHSINHPFSIYVAALCIVLMAEVGQVIFSLAAATTAETRAQRWGLAIGAGICTAIALVGNAEIVRPWTQASASVALLASAAQTHGAGAFVWLETFAPPVLVLITAQILKAQMLHSIERRHEAQSAFADAHRQWEAQSAEAVRSWHETYEHAHEHLSWPRVQANALRDALRRANARSSAVMRELTDDDWRALILREVSADAWYERAEQRAQAHQARIDEEQRSAQTEERTSARTSGAPGGQRTGVTDGAVRENPDGTYTGVCPDCGKEFNSPTHNGATNALSAHMGRWCEVARSARAAQVVVESAVTAHSNGTGE